LVAPVLEQGVTRRMVYLPEGVWYDYWTGERVEGKQYILREAPIDVCPIYIKAGSLIPTYDVVQYVGEKPYDRVTLLATPGEARYTHFQDNGEDYAYQEGAYNLYEFVVDESEKLHTNMIHKGYTPYEEITIQWIGK